jgi:hypothetical protein
MSFPEPDAALLRDLARQSDVEVVIRGHLWVEAELIGLVQFMLPQPQHLDLARLGVRRLVRLAAALGAVLPEDIPAYDALNKLRNKVAHNLGGDITSADEQAIFGSMDGPRRATLVDVYSKFAPDRNPGGLRVMIMYLVVILHVQRQAIMAVGDAVASGETDHPRESAAERLRSMASDIEGRLPQ